MLLVPRLCPECGELVYDGNRCQAHRVERRRAADRRRPNGSARGYTREWAVFSRDYLASHPYCASPECARLGDIIELDETRRERAEAKKVTAL